MWKGKRIACTKKLNISTVKPLKGVAISAIGWIKVMFVLQDELARPDRHVCEDIIWGADWKNKNIFSYYDMLLK